MPPDSTVTRAKLVAAAEHLFARRGLDVPIRDIHALAGQRNASALQYHFGDRNGLLMAILQTHALTDDEIEAAQKEYAAHHPDARLVVTAIVGRFRSHLATPEGRDWARVTSQLMLRAPIRQAMLDAVAEGVARPHSPSLEAIEALLHTHVPDLPRNLADERAMGALQFIAFMVAQRARVIDDEDDAQTTDEQAFIDNLVDMTVGALTAPATATSSGSAVTGP